MNDTTTKVGPARTSALELAEGLLRAHVAAPFLPEDHALFPPDPTVDAVALADELVEELDRLAAAAVDDPFSNPVLMLARHLSRRLDEATLSLSALEQAVQYLTAEAFVARARRLRFYLGEVDPERNAAILRQTVRGLATDKAGHTIPFEQFRACVERESFGIVFTAHPTFNQTAPLSEALADLAVGPSDREAAARHIELVRRSVHRPETMTLEREHEISLAAVANLHRALHRAYEAIFDVAQALYPNRWTELTPRLVSIASWVGYDLDGRSDIGWTDTLHKRLIDQALWLTSTLDEMASISGLVAAEPDPTILREALDRMVAPLVLMRDEVTSEIAVFGALPEDAALARARISEMSRRIVAGDARRLTEASELAAGLERAIALARLPALVRRLLILRAGIAGSGLGMARVHVRINASQLHNALRSEIALDSVPDDPRFRTAYLARLEAMLDSVAPETINFGSIIAERASARRLFMVVAQMLKHIDRSTPVRFLIAECESAFTVLAALYFARLFGVEDRVDISPLLETQRALEVGSRMIDQLLGNKHFRAYVARRGRLCVQTGYSDGGRYLGQLSAAVSIERFRLRLARVLADHELDGIDLVVFDTHGESIGRGGHPGGLAQALDYVDTPTSRQAFREAGIALVEEVSFQGGDGYLYFANATSAFAALTRILEHALVTPDPGDDPFYAEGDYVREAFTAATQFQVDLMDDADYGALLGGFAPNLLYPSGSRPTFREHDDGESGITYAAELRAIPHNASLLQLGFAANVLGGLGDAVGRDAQRFATLVQASSRLTSFMGVARYAVAIGSFDALGAYVATTSPALWLARAASTRNRQAARRMCDVASLLEHANLHDRQDRVARKLRRDFIIFSETLSADPTAGVAPQTRSALAVLHAIRIALIHEIYLLTTRIPDFAPQLGTTRPRIILRLLHLDVPGALAALERIFPAASRDDGDSGEFGEIATYRGEDSRTYEAEHAEVFGPLRNLHELVRRVSSAITHRVGFFG